jgi:hypothetical protein
MRRKEDVEKHKQFMNNPFLALTKSIEKNYNSRQSKIKKRTCIYELDVQAGAKVWQICHS